MFFDTECGLDGPSIRELPGAKLRALSEKERESFRFTFASDDHGMQRRFKPKLFGDLDHPIFATGRSATLRTRSQIIEVPMLSPSRSIRWPGLPVAPRQLLDLAT